MERSFLKALGLSDDQINAVFSEYGREKTAHDTELNNLKEQLKTANAKAETVKLYEKGGEKYIDPTEYANLKQYKVDTEKAAVEKKQKESAAELFKSYSETNKRFLTDLYSSKIAYDDAGKVTNSNDILKDVKERYPDLTIETGNDGTHSGGGGYSGGNGGTGGKTQVVY